MLYLNQEKSPRNTIRTTSTIYLGLEDENKEEDSEDEDEVEDGGGKTDDGFGDNENARLLSKWEDEIKKLWDNLISDLTVLKRMTHSPNRKTPYNKFYEWEAWKTNDC